MPSNIIDGFRLKYLVLHPRKRCRVAESEASKYTVIKRTSLFFNRSGVIGRVCPNSYSQNRLRVDRINRGRRCRRRQIRLRPPSWPFWWWAAPRRRRR